MFEFQKDGITLNLIKLLQVEFNAKFSGIRGNIQATELNAVQQN